MKLIPHAPLTATPAFKESVTVTEQKGTQSALKPGHTDGNPLPSTDLKIRGQRPPRGPGRHVACLNH